MQPFYEVGDYEAELYRNCDEPGFEIVFPQAGQPEKRPLMAARLTKPNTDEPSNNPVTVRVSDRWRVVYDGKPYLKGDTLTVPRACCAGMGAIPLG